MLEAENNSRDFSLLPFPLDQIFCITSHSRHKVLSKMLSSFKDIQYIFLYIYTYISIYTSPTFSEIVSEYKNQSSSTFKFNLFTYGQ